MLQGPYISKKRSPKIRAQYAAIGGKSPILHWTELQGREMSKKLDVLSPQVWVLLMPAFHWQPTRSCSGDRAHDSRGFGHQYVADRTAQAVRRVSVRTALH